mmetsp:Transcript_110253/g.311719  ORF Transcript_110253/g.311719 Transcript_110253/m.311719 type:complete len:345 (-) Transcript_110253:462-1496(-)
MLASVNLLKIIFELTCWDHLVGRCTTSSIDTTPVKTVPRIEHIVGLCLSSSCPHLLGNKLLRPVVHSLHECLLGPLAGRLGALVPDESAPVADDKNRVRAGGGKTDVRQADAVEVCGVQRGLWGLESLVAGPRRGGGARGRRCGRLGCGGRGRGHRSGDSRGGAGACGGGGGRGGDCGGAGSGRCGGLEAHVLRKINVHAASDPDSATAIVRVHVGKPGAAGAADGGVDLHPDTALGLMGPPSAPREVVVVALRAAVKDVPVGCEPRVPALQPLDARGLVQKQMRGAGGLVPGFGPRGHGFPGRIGVAGGAVRHSGRRAAACASRGQLPARGGVLAHDAVVGLS